MDLSAGSILAGLIFGSIGFVAFIYGKKMVLFRTMGIGIALMAFPYFVQNTGWQFGIGAVLTAALFVFRE